MFALKGNGQIFYRELLSHQGINEVVSAGGDLEGRWHVGISIERPRGYLRNRFRN